MLNDLTGQRFERLTVLEYIKNSMRGAYFKCRCNCGNTIIARGNHLKSGNIKSCGCLQKELLVQRSQTHGMTKTRIHHIWLNMKYRCNNSNCNHYESYGGRGIKVCEEWEKSFESFYDWSSKNGYEKKLSLDRVDNDKGYSPDNCRWSTNMEQQNNRRVNHILTLDGVSKTLAEWGRSTGISSKTIKARLNNGWSVKDALTER